MTHRTEKLRSNRLSLDKIPVQRSLGFTLIELVVVIVLLGILASVYFQQDIDSSLWQEQRFADAWFKAYTQAKQHTFYGQQTVTIDLKDQAFVFTPQTGAGDKTSWAVLKPDFVQVEEGAFPFELTPESMSASAKAPKVILKMNHSEILLDRATYYAFMQAKS